MFNAKAGAQTRTPHQKDAGEAQEEAGEAQKEGQTGGKHQSTSADLKKAKHCPWRKRRLNRTLASPSLETMKP